MVTANSSLDMSIESENHHQNPDPAEKVPRSPPIGTIMNRAEWLEYCNQHLRNGREYIYHYTSSNGANQILESGFIQIHFNHRIPVFGTGVFMTKLGPSVGYDKLWYNNYKRHEFFKNRFEFAFAIRVDQINPIRFFDQYPPMDRDLWRNETDIQLQDVEYYAINTGWNY